MRPHRRPIWWPDDQPWPPERDRTDWTGPPWGRRSWGGQAWSSEREHRGGMRRGIGCFIALLATLVVSVGILVLWLLANLFGFAVQGPLADFARPAGLVVLVAGLIALMVGIRLARSVGAPLSELVDAAGRIEASDYSVRVPETERGPGEMRGLGRAFNSMAARLESEDETRRRLLADVSHELRTPLAVIQGNLEALIDGVYPADEAHLTSILDETQVLARLIDDLRTLSLAESGALPLHREPTDIAALLEDVAASHRRPARRRGHDDRGRASTGANRCRCWTSIPSGSGRSSPTSSRTRSGTCPTGGAIRLAARLEHGTGPRGGGDHGQRRRPRHPARARGDRVRALHEVGGVPRLGPGARHRARHRRGARRLRSGSCRLGSTGARIEITLPVDEGGQSQAPR